MSGRMSILLGSRRGGWISPFVDVVFNLMITFFIFVMVLLLLFRAERFVTFVDGSLGPATPYVDYAGRLAAKDGSGDYEYHLVTSVADAGGTWVIDGQDNLMIDLATGRVAGRFAKWHDPSSAAPAGIRQRAFGAIVIDRRKTVEVEPSAVIWIAGQPLVFHRASRLTDAANQSPPFWMPPGEPAPQLTPMGGAKIKARYADAALFSVPITPRDQPFDPRKNGLRSLTPDKLFFSGVVGQPMLYPIAIQGGIEPYEFSVVGEPRGEAVAGIRFDTAGRFIGVPSAPGRAEFTIAVKDAQTASGDWSTARDLNASGKGVSTYSEIVVQVAVSPPLSAGLAFPGPFGRSGDRAAIQASVAGGQGPFEWEPVRIPLGWSIDRERGMIEGSLPAPGRIDVQLRVRDARGQIAETAGTWLVLPALPPPKVIGGAP